MERLARSSTFPTGIYAKYKQATQYFLTWLLLARKDRVNGTKKNPIDMYESITKEIANDPKMLSTELLRALPRALEACESAITLRERVTVYFAESADDAHAHFLWQLKRWFNILKQTYRGYRQTVGKATEKSRGPQPETLKKEIDFSNYHEVLALPDDYFGDDTEDSSLTKSSSTVRCLSTVEKKSIRDTFFARDLKAELSYLLMELEELSEAVYSVFHDVKRDEKTLLEATAVTKIAIDSAQSALAAFQARYPSIRDAEDLSILIRSRMSIVKLDRLLSRVKEAWQPEADSSACRYQYVPGTVLADVMWLTSTLLNIGEDIRTNLENVLPERRSEYDEEETRHYTVPDCHSYSQFLIQHLVPLLNSTQYLHSCKVNTNKTLLQMWFIRPYQRFSTDGTVTPHLLFSCICWIRSIAALQGCRALGQTIGLANLHRWELQDRLAESMKVDECVGVTEYQREMGFSLQGMEGMNAFAPYHRVNPLFAGCMLFDAQIKYLDIGHEKLTLNPSFHTFAHVYSALCNRRLLEPIPLLDDVLQVYDSALFTPSRASSKRGSFTTSYLRSQRINDTNLRRPAHPALQTPAILNASFVETCRVYQLLCRSNYSVLRSEPNSRGSLERLLASVSDLCVQEIYQSRLLSLDMLRVNDTIREVVKTLREELVRGRPSYSMGDNRGSVEGRAENEIAVAFPLLPLLDLIDDGGKSCSLPTKRVLARYAMIGITTPAAFCAFALDLCRRAAAVIARHFAGMSSAMSERHFFTLPLTASWASKEFGPRPPRRGIGDANPAVEFKALKKMLSCSQGRLRGDQLEVFKRRVIAMPEVLGEVSEDPTEELCTLLHHVAAGPAHDRSLTEWLVQMGALALEPKPVRDLSVMKTNEGDRPVLFDALAVHSAARRGHIDIVKLLLHAGNMRDVDTTTFRTRESLMHIAVKTNNRPLVESLILFEPDVTRVDALGNHVWDYGSDEWLKAFTMFLPKFQEATKQTSCDRPSYEQTSTRKDELWEALERQRNGGQQAAPIRNRSPHSLILTEHVDSHEATEPSISSGSKNTFKKKSKKKKKKPMSCPSQEAPIASSSLLEQFIETSNTIEDEDRHGVNRLAFALNSLESVTTTQEVREANARIALDVVEKIQLSIDVLKPKKSLALEAVIKRELLDANRVIRLLDTYHHQLAHSSPLEATSCVVKLNLFASPPNDVEFQSLFSLAINTAVFLTVFQEKARGCELMALVERRLLTIPQRTRLFRALVTAYVSTRHSLKLEPALGSSVESQTQFDWYVSTLVSVDDQELLELDRLHECKVYAYIVACGWAGVSAFDETFSLIYGAAEPDDVVVVVPDGIVVGGDTLAAVNDLVRVVQRSAEQSGLLLNDERSQIGVSKLIFLGFEFSHSRIVRVSVP